MEAFFSPWLTRIDETVLVLVLVTNLEILGSLEKFLIKS